MRLLGITFALLCLTAAPAYAQFVGGGGGNPYGNPMYGPNGNNYAGTQGYGYGGGNPGMLSTGEGVPGSSQFLSCACAQRIINNTLQMDPACANFARAVSQAAATPGAVSAGAAPASPFGVMHQQR